MAAQTTTATAQKPAPALSAWLLPVALTWIIPGAGHFMLKKTGRGALLFVSVVCMFALGLMMRGYMFTPESGDPLTTLINYGGFFCNLASGALYFGAMMFGYVQPDLAGHVHDYGTKFLVTAGLLNILSMVDVYEIIAGEKE